jgi:hypothetical protein
VVNAGQLLDIGKFINLEAGFNECVPAAIAGSLKYLEGTGRIDFSEDINDIKSWIGWVGWGTPPGWYALKQQYLEEKDISVRFIDANTSLTQSTVLELIDELEAGQDIEVDGNGHVEVLVGIRLRSDGTIELDLFDDNQADGKIDPMHTSLYDDVNNMIEGWLGLERFVVECPDYSTVPNQGGWREQAKLTASDGNATDRFGWSVGIDGDYAVVGTYSADANGVNSGAAYVFEHNDANWTETTKLVGSDTVASDEFGYSVSISGPYAIIGAKRNDDKGSNTDKGSAYIFAPNGVNPGLWEEQTKLTASDGNNRMGFGSSVSISGDRAVVGSFNAGDSTTGVAYVFERSSNPGDPNWYEKDTLTASDGNSIGDYFGYSVAVDGDYVVVGAMYSDGNAPRSGAAYIFTPNGVDPNIWDEQATLTASDGNDLDEFGNSVSISGNYVVVGAPGDEPNGVFSGSVYVFERQGTNWTEQAKLIASDGDDRDAFGTSVSIKEKRIIAGADGDDHNGITNSGSAYIFDRSGITWTEKSKLIASDSGYRDFFGYSVGVDRCYAIVGAYNDNIYQPGPGAAYIFKAMPEDPTGDCVVDWEDLKILADQWLTSN